MSADLGVSKGSVVLLYMPMVPEALVAMLACARLGAVHGVTFGGFAPAELAARIGRDADGGGHLVVRHPEGQGAAVPPGRARGHRAGGARSGACGGAPAPEARTLEPLRGWFDFDEASARDAARVRARPRERPAYVLYVGHDRPAQGVRDNSHAVALQWTMDRLGHRAGRDLLCGERHRLGGRPQYICYGPRCTAARQSSRKPVGTPDAASTGASSRGTRSRMFTAPTACARCVSSTLDEARPPVLDRRGLPARAAARTRKFDRRRAGGGARPVSRARSSGGGARPALATPRRWASRSRQRGDCGLAHRGRSEGRRKWARRSCPADVRSQGGRAETGAPPRRVRLGRPTRARAHGRCRLAARAQCGTGDELRAARSARWLPSCRCRPARCRRCTRTRQGT